MSYKIPLFDVNIGFEEQDAALQTIKSGWISTGPKCLEFEKLFSEMLNVKHAVTLANCTTALHLAYEALGIGEGDEVICPSLSFVATVNAIKYVKATPVFCDITSYYDLNIDPLKIEKLITSKTKGIVVMHFAGFPCDMDEIMSIASRHNLKIIEDACHGPLSEYKGKKLGTIGDVGCFSFFSNKNISTGEGGMIVTNDDVIEKEIRLLRSHGMTTMSYQRASGHATDYDVVKLGYNYRMDDIRASIGIEQLKKLKADLNKRIEIRELYIDLLQELAEFIYIPFESNKEFVSNYVMPIILKENLNRNQVRSLMHEKGIQTSVHYPAIHRFSIYKDCLNGLELPLTEYVADQEITLPMYGNLSKEDVITVVNTLKEAISNT